MFYIFMLWAIPSAIGIGGMLAVGLGINALSRKYESEEE